MTEVAIFFSSYFLMGAHEGSLVYTCVRIRVRFHFHNEECQEDQTKVTLDEIPYIPRSYMGRWVITVITHHRLAVRFLSPGS